MKNYKQNYIHKPYLFLAILFSLLSCQKEVVSKITFERKLSGIKPETEFRLDSLRNDKWQKCYIIPPYQQYNSALNMWRANLCATFLGNLVYPTPASKMLHFP